MVRPIRSYSTSAGGRSNQRSLSKEGQTIRLRSGSAGGRPVKSKDNEADEEHEPIQVIGFWLPAKFPLALLDIVFSLQLSL